MSREIGMYSDTKPTCKRKSGESEARNLLLPVVLAIVLPLLFLGAIALPFLSDNGDNTSEKSGTVKQDSTIDDNMKRSGVVNHGNISIVSIDIILAPYVWKSYLKDVITSDSVHVNIELSMTSRVQKGKELQLVKNYGANWFYTSFIYHYKELVQQSFTENVGYQELIDSPSETRNHLFTRMATDLLKGMSNEYLLPVDILEVKVNSIDKIDR